MSELAKRPEVHVVLTGLTASNEEIQSERKRRWGKGTEDERQVSGSGYMPGTRPSPPRPEQPVEKTREQESAKRAGATARTRCKGRGEKRLQKK